MKGLQLGLGIFGFMHEFGELQLPIWQLANMKHKQSKLWLLLLLLLLFDDFAPTSAHPLLFSYKQFVQIHLNVMFACIKYP